MTGTETTKIFQMRFEDLMIESGKTLRDIANDTGISRAALNNYANDKAEIGINNVVKLAKYFNVSADYLLGLSDAKTNDKDLQSICDYIGISVENVMCLHDCAIPYTNENLPKAFEDATNRKNAYYLKILNNILADDDIERVVGEQLTRLTSLSTRLNRILELLSTIETERNIFNFQDNLEQTWEEFFNICDQYQIMMFNAEKIKKIFSNSIDSRLTNKLGNRKIIKKIRESYCNVEQAFAVLKQNPKECEEYLYIQLFLINIDEILKSMEADFFGNSNEAE